MTLREALLSVDMNKVYKLINKKDNTGIVDKNKCPSMEQTINSYSNVVRELLNKPLTKPYSLHWLVTKTTDFFSKKKYFDVCFYNPKYVAPQKDLKPWGCQGKSKPPKGYYNCNATKHNRTFAIGWTSWKKVIDTPIINEGNYTLERVIAEILWEMTFYGWTEEKVNKKIKDIKDQIKIATDEVKQGKCIQIPPTKKGGKTIVIPDSVSKAFIDLVNKSNKKK